MDKDNELEKMVQQHLDNMNLGMTELQKERRRTLCTGTKVSKILGKSKFGTGYDVYARCKGLVEDNPPTPAMIRGTVFERAILDYYEIRCGVILERPDHTMVHPTEDWAGASPDAFYQDEDGCLVIVDAKTSRSRQDWGDEFSDDMPIDYQLQLLWYAYVLGAALDCPVKRLDVCTFFPMQDEFSIYTMTPDQEVVEKIVERCRQWWYRHIVCNVAPEIDGSESASKVVNLSPHLDDDVHKGDESLVSTIEELLSIKKQIKDLDFQKKTLENSIKSSIGTSSGLYYAGRKATWKEQKGRSSVDIKKLTEDHPDLVEAYKKEGKAFRVLRVK